MSMRYRIRENRTATLAGVPHQDLRSILTAAAVQYYDEIAKLRKRARPRPGDAEAMAFYRAQVQTLDVLKASMDAEIDRVNRAGRPVRAPTKEERRRAVIEARKERILLEEVLDQALAEYASEREAGGRTGSPVPGAGGDGDGRREPG